MYGPDVPQPVFVNLEYIFFLFYRKVETFFSVGGFLYVVRVLFTLIAILLITVILYALVRLWEIQKEALKAKKARSVSAPVTAASVGPKNETWEHIRRRGLSDNENDWRLAIIEADIYLDRILQQKGYQGETLSDKLKQVAPEKLASLQMAWEAHKMRNQIAHQGTAFTLTRPEARKAISYFEAVFRELGMIEDDPTAESGLA